MSSIRCYSRHSPPSRRAEAIGVLLPLLPQPHHPLRASHLFPRGLRWILHLQARPSPPSRPRRSARRATASAPLDGVRRRRRPRGSVRRRPRSCRPRCQTVSVRARRRPRPSSTRSAAVREMMRERSYNRVSCFRKTARYTRPQTHAHTQTTRSRHRYTLARSLCLALSIVPPFQHSIHVHAYSAPRLHFPPTTLVDSSPQHACGRRVARSTRCSSLPSDTR